MLSEMDYYELMDFRFAIEKRCISSLTQAFSGGEDEAGKAVEDLAGVVHSLHKAALEADLDTLIQGDYEFHNIIVQNHTNSLFRSIYEILRSFLIDVTKEMLTQYENPLDIYLEHKAILYSIRTGDPGRAVSELKVHIENCKVLLKAILA